MAPPETPAGSDGSTVGGGSDLGAGADLAGADLAVADLAPSPDLAVPLDFATPPDLTVPPDFTTPPDLTPPCVDAGTACTNSNPGACAMGHAVCVNNVLTCVSDVTAQPCYDGPVGTAGQGVCKAGTQTCTGSLGACMGEVTPAPRENCFNDLDDDCDGRVNNGCPDHVELGAPRALLAQGGSGGGPASARCPANAWVVKGDFLFDDTDVHATGVRIYCATPTLVRGPSSYSITLGAVTPSPYTSFQGNTYTPPDGTIDCNIASGFVAGFSTTGYAGQYVDALGMFCANGALTLNADNTLTVTMTRNSTGGYFKGQTTSTFFDEPCGANEVLIGWDGRTGSWEDQVTPICAPLVVVYK